MTEYNPRGELQLDDSLHQSDNCGAAAAGTLADDARKGVKPATSAPWLPKRTKQADGTGWNFTKPTMSIAVRNWIAAHYDTKGVWGLYAKWIRPAVKALWRVATGYAYGDGAAWADLVAFLKDGRACQIAINYGVIQGTRFNACAGFTGRHWVECSQIVRRADGVVCVRVADPLADHRRPAIPQGPQLWPATLLRRAFTSTSTEIIYSV